MKEIRGGIMYVLAYTGTASNYALVVVTPTFGTGGTGQVWDWSAGGGATKMGYSPSFDPYNKDTTYYNFCGGPLAGVRTSINPGSFTVVANPSGAAIPW